MSDMFWTEGTIDAIEIALPGASVRFRLIPVTVRLVENIETKHMLFCKEGTDNQRDGRKVAIDGKLLPMPKAGNGKGGLWFALRYCFVAKLLMEAKMSRCAVRVSIWKNELMEGQGSTPEKAMMVSKVMFI